MSKRGSDRTVLWVVTTQWRAQATSFSEDNNARTPCLNRFGADALVLTQAVTSHPFGPFARAALLTGVLSPENGVSDYYDPLPQTARTIAHDAADFGAETAFFGKWHLGQRDREAQLVGEAHARAVVPPAARGGFSFWEGFESGFLLNDPWLHGSRLPVPTQFPGYQSDIVCRRARDWLCDRSRGRSWFCLVSLEAPHPPYDAPAGGVSPPSPRAIQLRPNVPPGGEVEARARRELAGYYAHIEATDRAIGELLDAVDLRSTLVIFTSVHGDMHGAHGLFRKGWPHEESVRVPLVISGPGVQPGADPSCVSLSDLPAMTRAWLDAGVLGVKPFPFARISMPSVVRLPDQCDRVWRGVRSAKRKLVLNEDGSPWLFFDLQNDPLELRNLVGDAGWESEMAAWRARTD